MDKKKRVPKRDAFWPAPSNSSAEAVEFREKMYWLRKTGQLIEARREKEVDEREALRWQLGDYYGD